MQAFSTAVEAVGGCPRIWGFVDGTFRGFCRPAGSDEAQRAVYNGHKRQHGQQWQAIVTPDGLASSLCGPFLGTANDWMMWLESGCEDRLKQLMDHMEEPEWLFLYGDPAYRCTTGIMSPFSHPRGRRHLPLDEQAFNRSLSSARIAVENCFGRTQQLFSYMAFSKGLRSGSQPVAAYFAIAILLTNCHTCFHGNLISRRFKVDPPSIEAYLCI
jgi:hypothetical protein